MSISNLDIVTEDLLKPLPRARGGIIPVTGSLPSVRYELVEGVWGIDLNLDVDIINLERLDDKGDEYIRIKLWVFRNGQKLYFGNGFTIDILENKLILAYEAENEDFEIYLYP